MSSRIRASLPTKIAVVFLAVGIGALAASCGGKKSAAPPASTTTTTPATSTTTTPTTTTKPALRPKPPTTTVERMEPLKGNPVAGAAIFKANGCGGCHTLKAAGSTGTVGPNLDQLKPPQARIVLQVVMGGPPMPAFSNLSDKQVADVAAYVYKSTH